MTSEKMLPAIVTGVQPSDARGGESSRVWLLPVLCALIAMVSVISIVLVENILISRFFPLMSRLPTVFSIAYLSREVAALAERPGQVIFVGDSIVWGFRIPASATAVSVLSARGCPCRNLAYKHGSPASYYGLVRILEARQVRPRAVVLEINRASFSPATPGYRMFGGPIAELADPYLDADDRATLTLEPHRSKGLRVVVDRWLSSFSKLYEMRGEIRALIYGDDDPPAPPWDPTLIRRRYDIPAINEENVSVRYLAKTLSLLRTNRTPVLAYLAPVNHRIVDRHVDRKMYRKNTQYMVLLLRRNGAHVLDLESAFSVGDFVDEGHLNATGQRRLASILANALAKIVGNVTDN